MWLSSNRKYYWRCTRNRNLPNPESFWHFGPKSKTAYSGLPFLKCKKIIKEYVADPFLMTDGLKFDFRVYGVIKSINPLSLHVAREGMARFCTEKYAKPTTANMDNLYAHLTNYSLNKASDTYVHSTSLQEQVRGNSFEREIRKNLGSKRLLSTVFHQLSNKGLRTKKLWHDIKLILVKVWIGTKNKA